MLRAEAEWLSRQLAGLAEGDILLNIGSSTGEFRTREQPFIDQLIFRPLVARRVTVVHSDIKAADGVDVIANLLQPDGFCQLKKLGAKSVLCSNLLEHVPNLGEMARRLEELLPSGGELFLTVPHSYPFHPDPIDNGFRPDITQLCQLFATMHMRVGTVVSDMSFADELRDVKLGARRVARSLIPLPPLRNWLGALDRWRWLTCPQ